MHYAITVSMVRNPSQPVIMRYAITVSMMHYMLSHLGQLMCS